MNAPGAEILVILGVRLVSPLGGRLNQHWLVEAGGERLVLRRWASSVDDIRYELRLLDRIAAMGWPVSPALAEPVASEGHLWNLFPFLPGEPPAHERPPSDQRMCGRLLARFHADLARLHDVGQRGTWRRCEEILGDATLDQILSEQEQKQPEDVRVVRWHLNRARERIAGLSLSDRPDIVIHGDFTPWNLRFQDGKLSGILDFELAHRDHRVGDFALSWRGKYDDVIHGYNEVSPLEPEEWALLTPLWWAGLIEGVCRDMAQGTRDDGWYLQKLLVRSPVMGPDAVEYR